MALDRVSTAPAPKVKQARKIKATEVHVADFDLLRKDGKGNIFRGIIDLGKGTAQIRQETFPTTLDADGVNDIVEYFGEVENLLRNAPAPSIADEHGVAPKSASAPAAAATKTVAKAAKK